MSDRTRDLLARVRARAAKDKAAGVEYPHPCPVVAQALINEMESGRNATSAFAGNHSRLAPTPGTGPKGPEPQS